MKHKHYDCIVAWAAGKTIQRNFSPVDGWEDWTSQKSPSWHEDAEYRIKPEPMPDRIVVTDLWRQRDYGMLHMGEFRLTFDGETGKLKSAEVVNGLHI